MKRSKYEDHIDSGKAPQDRGRDKALAASDGDHDFPDEMVPRLVVNLFTDDDAMKALKLGPPTNNCSA